MYASSSILVLIKALSVAFALPHIPSNLYSRQNQEGSVAGYRLSDCDGDYVPGKTAADGTTFWPNPTGYGCLTFNTPAEYIGVNYAGYYGLVLFTDPHCSPNHYLAVLHNPAKLNIYGFGGVVCGRQDVFNSTIGSFKFLQASEIKEYDDRHPVLGGAKTSK